MMLDLTDEETDALAGLLAGHRLRPLSALAARSDIEGHSREDPTGAGP
jgi:hypothetical protein